MVICCLKVINNNNNNNNNTAKPLDRNVIRKKAEHKFKFKKLSTETQ